MGIFKDVRDLSAMGKEARQNYDPVAQVRAASEQMRLAAQQPTATGHVSTAMVVSLNDTGTIVNMAPVISVDLTLLPTGAPASAAQTMLHGHAALTRCTAGQLVQVIVDPNDPSTVTLA